MQRTLGAGAVGGQGAIVADLTGWREEKKGDKGGRVRCERDRKQREGERVTSGYWL